MWRRALPLEVEFWDDYLSRHGGEWPDEYPRRVDPDEPLAEPLIVERLDRFPDPVVSILDVGAGPLTLLGKRHPRKRLEITAVDPLAEEYDRLLAKAGIDPPVRTVSIAGEELLERLGPDRFDVAFARNSVDHSADPFVVIENMLAVVRPGGFVALRHYRNEGKSTGYVQLHNWNFDIVDGELVVWGRRGSHNLTRELAGRAAFECCLDHSSDKTPWVTAVLERPVGANHGL